MEFSQTQQQQQRLALAKFNTFFPMVVSDNDINKIKIFFFKEHKTSTEFAVDAEDVLGICMDFKQELYFNLQIVLKYNESEWSHHPKFSTYFVNSKGAEQDHFYSFQPGMHCPNLLSQTKFIPPDFSTSHNQMSVDIPWLRKNGMGLFLFQKKELKLLKDVKTITFKFSFATIPENFTIYLLFKKSNDQ